MRRWQVLFGLVAGISVLGGGGMGALHAQLPISPPPLGELIHSFEEERPTATAYSIWNAAQSQRHEVWFRVIGGDADYLQRLRVYKEQAAPRSPDMLPPESARLYEIEGNRTSEWFFLGSESAFFTYYFDGDNRPSAGDGWSNAKAVRVKKSIYRNGDRYELRFEDLNILDDYNDLEVEVILLRR